MGRAASVACYLASLLAILAAADYVMYLRYRHVSWGDPPRGAPPPPPPGVATQTLRRLGWLRTDKPSSFIHFPVQKPAGTIRIGCIGDSFTYGAEVAGRDDYPSILQDLLRQKGFRNVEVLNFSSGWYGFQQAYILWDEVARSYGLDYILLGPQTFFPNRDTTFDHSSPATRYLLHARYVLDGDGVRLVDLPGDSRRERSDRYNAFLPPWNALRYDRRAPAFLSCLLPRGRELRNPFYYRRDIAAEASEIYRRLLRRMADSGTQVIVGHYTEGIVSLAQGLRRPNIYGARLMQQDAFPYKAPNNHNAPAGNRLVAEQFFALLTHQRSYRPDLMNVRDIPVIETGGGSPHASVSDYRRLTLEEGRGSSWSLMRIDDGEEVQTMSPKAFHGSGTHAIVGMQFPDQPFVDALFVPAGFPVREGDALVARFDGPGEPAEFVLGKAELLRAGLGLVRIRMDPRLRPALPIFRDRSAVFSPDNKLRRRLAGRRPVYLSLSGRQLLMMTGAEGGSRGKLKPLQGSFLKFYAPQDPGRGRANGTISFRLQPPQGPPVEIDISRWRRLPAPWTAEFPTPFTFPALSKPDQPKRTRKTERQEPQASRPPAPAGVR
jgi:hypothetical protein